MIQSLYKKLSDSDKHLRMTLDRLQQESFKNNQLIVTLQEKEAQLLSCLEVGDRVCRHLAVIQQEDDVWKLQRFDREQFERNWSVIKHLRQERAETPMDIDQVQRDVLTKHEKFMNHHDPINEDSNSEASNNSKTNKARDVTTKSQMKKLGKTAVSDRDSMK